MKFLPPLLLAVLALAGCTTAETHKAPATDLAKYRRLFVEHRLADGLNLDRQIATELRRLGYEATSGPLTMLPDQGIDAVVTYEDRWTWDFKSYLIEFTLAVRTARTDKPLASGRYHQPTAFPKEPDAVIRAVLAPLFGKK